MLRFAVFTVSLACPLVAASVEQANWSGPYRACSNKSELLKSSHMDLVVRIDTVNPAIAVAFRRALAFWSNVLDMSYHEDAASDCSLALVDGTPEVLSASQNVARSQFADMANFQAWIAFDPHAPDYMTPDEMYATAVHELGHLFGLRHNPRASSIMYFLDCDGASSLDETDLQALAIRHAVRAHAAGAIPIAP
jgi:hypothetical protein